MRGLATLKSAYKMGRDSPEETVETLANNASALISAAVGLGVTVIILLVMILISGEFADAIPDSGAFANASDDTVDHGGTAYTIMAVALLVVPVGAVLGVLAAYLGGWIQFGGNGRRR